MRRALSLLLVIVLAAAGFYVVWPAWTAYRIRHAIETNDPADLAERIDFETVRARAKPAVAAQMQRSIEQLKQQSGSLGSLLSDQLKASLGSTLAAAAVDTALTPENVIRFARQGKDIGRIIKDIARESATTKGSTTTEPGTAPGSSPAPNAPATPSTPPEAPAHKLTLDNIKSYRLTGPLGIRVAVAHDPKATSPDAIADLEFTGGTWKVVGILPQF